MENSRFKWSNLLGARQNDSGKIESDEKVVKYCSKQADISQLPDVELVWLYEQTMQLNIWQPLGDLKCWLRDLRECRKKVVRVRGQQQTSRFIRIKKMQRDVYGGDIQKRGSSYSIDKRCLTHASEAKNETQWIQTNLIVGLTMPNWRHTPWAQPAIMLRNYVLSHMLQDTKTWQSKVSAWWD